MKIPTLIGIAAIIALIALSGLYYYYAPPSPPPANFSVSEVRAINITGNSATIVWESNIPSVGEVLFDKAGTFSQRAGDVRDRGLSKERMVHFVNLSGLTPGTKYSYRIKNDEVVNSEILEFQTGTFVEKNEGELTYSFIKPLKGTILNTNLNPISESLVFLEIPGASSLGTFSSTSGNFILPLKTVLNTELDKLFIIPEDTTAKLVIIKGTLRSEVKIKLSEDKVNLPPITIGSNLDLTSFEVQPFTKITFSTVSSFGNDFNGDQRVNSLDLALLKEAAGSAGSGSVNTQSNFDINKDGVVDQDDVNEFAKSLTE